MMHSFHAPAKINLFLHITGRRENGFHDLQSAVFFSDISDSLCFRESATTTLAVNGPYAEGIPTDSSNLVLKAYHLLKEIIPNLPELSITLTKNLPVAAGLGGGSSDAAIFLREVISTYQPQLINSEQVTRILQTLGSDLPVCYLAQPALMEGTGHSLHPWPTMPDFGVILVNPNIPLSTAKVYQAISSYSPVETFPSPATKSEWINLFQATHNDMQAPAIELVPEIATVLNQLSTLDGIPLCRMSGSGATCFALFTNREEAAKAANQLQQTHPDWWIRAGGIYHG